MTAPLQLPTTATSSPAQSSSLLQTNELVSELECMTAHELARWLRVNRKTVYEYAARKVIPCRRLGRRLVFLRSAVVAWLAHSPTTIATPGRR